jgi:hypothetical protein
VVFRGQLRRKPPLARTPAAGGYRIILEFYRGSHEAVDGKHEELVGFGGTATNRRMT